MSIYYNEQQFKCQISEALQNLRAVLHKTKHPELMESVPHQYADKYMAVEFLTNTMLAAVLNALNAAGLQSDQLQTLQRWGKEHVVALRFHASERCTFLQKVTRDVESLNRVEVVSTSDSGRTTKETAKVITQVTEYEWDFTSHCTLTAHPGTRPQDALVLADRQGTVRIVTRSEESPRPQAISRPPIDCALSPLLDPLTDKLQPSFAINRADPKCHTPRRNTQVEQMVTFSGDLFQWADKVLSYFKSDLFPLDAKVKLDMAALSAGPIFVPILPISMVEADQQSQGPTAPAPPPPPGTVTLPPGPCPEPLSVLPSLEDLNQCLGEQHRTLHAALQSLAGLWPAGGSPGPSGSAGSGVATVAEGRLCIVLGHLKAIAKRYAAAVDYVEDLLRRQLVQAVGRAVTPSDLVQYLEGHFRRLFRAAYRPALCSFAVRRPHHAPEGVVCVEAEESSGTMAKPVLTLTRVYDGQDQPMYFAVDAATRVEFRGMHHVHAYLCHTFSSEPAPRLQLVARARQFSCFVVLVGRMQSRDVFDPTYACLVQNMDDLRIPLDLEQLPTPQEFRDAIESLSPEQQEFAKAIRAMQLESTLFAVCVVQVKPQLEALLRLPAGALTKEIQLTQDLMDLFLQYQVPSDLLTVCEEGETPPAAPEAVERVRGHVRAMQDMIAKAKEKELREEEERAKKELLEARKYELQKECYTSGAYSSGGFGGGFGGGGGGGGASLCFSSAAYSSGGGGGGGGGSGYGSSCIPSYYMSRRVAAPLAQCPPPPAFKPMAESLPNRSSDPSPGATEGPAEPAEVGEGPVVDYTSLPAQLDRQYEALDVQGALRPTTLKPGKEWTRRSKAGLLSEMKAASLGKEEQKRERSRAMDLVEALSRSGALPLQPADLHLFVAATHCFDKTLLETVVQDNVNPIAPIERAAVAIASTIHAQPPAALVAPGEAPRLLAPEPRPSP